MQGGMCSSSLDLGVRILHLSPWPLVRFGQKDDKKIRITFPEMLKLNNLFCNQCTPAQLTGLYTASKNVPKMHRCQR